MGRVLACFRYCLVGDTIFLGISGAIVSIFAGYFIYQLYEYAPLTPDNVCGSPATLLAMGVITCCIGWFAWQFMNFCNKGQVIIFTVTLAIIMLIEIGIGIWALVRHEQLNYRALTFTQHEEIIALAITDQKPIWELMQSKLQCCGIDGPADYRGVNAIPWSCCNRNITNNNDKSICNNIYKQGCQHVVLNRTKSILLYVFLVALCSVLLQISFIACTTCYARLYTDTMKKARSEVAKRASLQSQRELDTKDNLLPHLESRLENLRYAEALPTVHNQHQSANQRHAS